MSTEAPTLAYLRRRYASPLDGQFDALTSIWRPGTRGSVVSLEAADHSVPAILTRDEIERVTAMSPRRHRAFLAGRMALKILGAKWGHVPQDKPASALDTTTPGRPEPRCGGGPGAPAGCSLAHDSRFAVAVASDRPIGVDIEAVTTRFLRIATGFTASSEREVAARSALGHPAALARCFTLKEAVVKATSGDLFRTFREVEVIDVGEDESVFIWRDRRWTARHATACGHVLTVFIHDG